MRARLYLLAVVVWPFALAAVASVTYFALTMSLGFISEGAALRGLALKALSIVLLGFFLSSMYYIVPNAVVDRRGALLGGTFATLGFAAMQKAFETFFVSSAILKSVYGAFAALPVFLAWLHLSWAVVLIGGLIAATAFRAERR
jgi:membrane protein